VPANEGKIAGKQKQAPRGAKQTPGGIGRNYTGKSNEKLNAIGNKILLLRNWDPQSASSFLANSKNGWTNTWSQGKCAKAVRQAINAGGIATPNNPILAADYLNYLPTLGFVSVDQNGYKPQVGDVAVFPSIKGNPSGHIEMYVKNGWRSDYIQPEKANDGSYGKGFFANQAWASHSFSIFRYGGSQ
jgi:hypothetical protein